jgi:hypothetical protein
LRRRCWTAAAHAVAAVRIRGAGWDIRHVIAIQIFRTVVHAAIGRPIGLWFECCRRLSFWRRLCTQAGCQLGDDSGVSSQQVENRRIDASLFGELVDDRRLERDLGLQERVGLPAEGVEHDEPRRHKLAVGIRHPGDLIERPDEGGVESGGLCLVRITPSVRAVEHGSAAGFQIGQCLPQHLGPGCGLRGF